MAILTQITHRLTRRHANQIYRSIYQTKKLWLQHVARYPSQDFFEVAQNVKHHVGGLSIITLD